MDFLTQAREILQVADKGLRGVMEKAVQAGQYSVVTHLVEIATALDRVSRECAGVKLVADSEQADTRLIGVQVASAAPVTPSNSLKRVAATTRQAKLEYPKFACDEGRLVKIGWSKREKAEYEHKAPREAALAVYVVLSKVQPAIAFKMEELLPIRLPDGTEVPSYQSYLVLAWLRHMNQIEKRANDSYLWIAEEISASSFDRAWDATPRRGVPERRKGK
jgi:hypothetical protein